MSTLAQEAPAPRINGDGRITVVVVDDHEAVRLGIQMLLDDEPGIKVLASASSYRDGLEAVARTAPDIAVVDFHLPGRDGLALTRRLVAMPSPPRVLIFSAYADERLELAALLAGADDVLGKNSLGLDLCYRIEALSRGKTRPISISARTLATLGDELAIDDRLILGMLAAGSDPEEIATVLHLSEAELDIRRSEMLQRIKAPPRLSTRQT